MLPHVNAKYRHILSRDRILILCGGNVETALGSASADEPAPAAALDTEKSGTECLLEGVLGSPTGDNCFLERRSSSGQVVTWSSGRGEVLPEEGVVDVTAAVEANLLLQGDQGRDVICLSRSNLGRESGVQVIDVGLVVLLVVQLHDLLGDHRLKSLVKMRK